MITLHRIKEVPREDWTTTRTGQVMLPLEALKHTSPNAGLWIALQQMDRDGVNQLPVIDKGHLLGMLSRKDVITFLGRLRELAGTNGSAKRELVKQEE
jgi:CBS domain-containing protein